MPAPMRPSRVHRRARAQRGAARLVSSRSVGRTMPHNLPCTCRAPELAPPRAAPRRRARDLPVVVRPSDRLRPRRQGSFSTASVRHDVTSLSSDDVHWFNEAPTSRSPTSSRAPMVVTAWPARTSPCGPRPRTRSGVRADSTGWDRERHPLRVHSSSGIWEGFVPASAPATLQYLVAGPAGAQEKADPVAAAAEYRRDRIGRAHASRAHRNPQWLSRRAAPQSPRRPMSIYEVPWAVDACAR